jgi:hypothetical protein
MADVATVLKDPNFQGMPIEERRKVISSLDQNFGQLHPDEQNKVLGFTPSFPQGSGTGSLPNMTNEDIKSAGRKVLDYLPAAGAVAGSILAPEGAIPAIGAAMLGGAAGSAVKQGTLAATGAKDAPQSWSEAAGNVAGDTAEQGVAEAGGVVSSP